MVLEVMKVVGPFMFVFVEAGFNFFTNRPSIESFIYHYRLWQQWQA